MTNPKWNQKGGIPKVLNFQEWKPGVQWITLEIVESNTYADEGLSNLEPLIKSKAAQMIADVAIHKMITRKL